MATFRMFNQAILAGASELSDTFNPDLEPDRYGTVMVTHSGAKLATSTNAAVYLQGSMDNTNWFDIEAMKVNDTSYINGLTSSWCRVVPLAKYIRMVSANGQGRTWNAWVYE